MQLSSVNVVPILIFIVIQFNYGYSKIIEDNQTQVIVTPQYLTRNRLFNFLYPTVNRTLEELISVEEDTWHFLPYKRIQYFVLKASDDCSDEDSNDVDSGLFTLEQLRSGAVIIHFIGVAYFFTLLTVVCNDYFLPAVECICEDLGLSTDVAAATFMASATTTPEFFTNTISTFFTESDLGLGTIVGSLMFNTLAVAAIASIASPTEVQMDWWPITRDSLLYSMNLTFLIAFAWDGAIYWYEALVMLCLYITYFCIMFNSRRLMIFVKKIVEGQLNFCQAVRSKLEAQHNKENDHCTTVSTITLPDAISQESHSDQIENNSKNEIIKNNQRKSLWRIPKTTKFKTFWWFYVWPIKFFLTCTIPSPKTFRKWYPMSFIMCIIWIGGNAFLIVQLIVIIGKTLDIPDSVMGLTFLAGGSCLPEAISAFIMARKGKGGMGVSNSLGSNSLSILFSLGLPWFIKTMVDGGSATKAFVNIDSYGMEFIILSLLLTVASLYTTMAIGGFRLKTLIGCILFAIYLLFITITILVELEVLFPTGNNC